MMTKTKFIELLNSLHGAPVQIIYYRHMRGWDWRVDVVWFESVEPYHSDTAACEICRRGRKLSGARSLEVAGAKAAKYRRWLEEWQEQQKKDGDQ